MIKYSPKNHACYNTRLLYKELPDDLIEITEAEHQVFMGNSTPEGKKLVTGIYPFKFEDIPEPPVSVTAKDELVSTLATLVYTFKDGRTIQVRPPSTGKPDEPNIRNAIEQLGRTGEPSIMWYMEDNTFQPVTATELQEALESGQDQTVAAWDAFRKAVGG
jgi:hypothetical protein